MNGFLPRDPVISGSQGLLPARVGAGGKNTVLCSRKVGPGFLGPGGRALLLGWMLYSGKPWPECVHIKEAPMAGEPQEKHES